MRWLIRWLFINFSGSEIRVTNAIISMQIRVLILPLFWLFLAWMHLHYPQMSKKWNWKLKVQLLYFPFSTFIFLASRQTMANSLSRSTSRNSDILLISRIVQRSGSLTILVNREGAMCINLAVSVFLMMSNSSTRLDTWLARINFFATEYRECFGIWQRNTAYTE